MKLKLNKDIEVLYNGLRFFLKKGENKIEKGLGKYVKENYKEVVEIKKPKTAERPKEEGKK